MSEIISVEIDITPTVYEIDVAIQGIQGPKGADGMGGEAGSVSWGDVGGNITDQTDLAAALAAKANESELAAKADASSVSAALALKADSSSVPTKTSQLTNDSDFLSSVPVVSVNGHTGAVTVTKSDVGLGNADNTADVDKPVSTAQQSALDAKADAYDLAALDASLAAVATSGSYNDLANKPTIPTQTSQLTNDAGFATSSSINSTSIINAIIFG